MSLISAGLDQIIAAGFKTSSQRGSIQIDGSSILNTFAPNFLNPGSLGSDPTSIINRNSNQVGQFQFPDDIGKYYMSMKFYEYKRPSVFAKLQLQTNNFLVLPLPANLTDDYGLSYGAEEQRGVQGYLAEALTAAGVQGVNPVGGLANSASKAIGDISPTASADLTSTLKNMGGDVATLAGGVASAGGAGVVSLANKTTLGTAALQALGLAENPYMTVVFAGPQYKTHTFQWLFSPRTAGESAKLTTIINMFKKAAHPSLASGTAAYIYPNIVQIQLKPEDTETHMYKFKKCVITNLRADYTPGQPAFFGDTSAPVQVILTIQFQEIELWTAEDWANVDTGAAQTSVIDRAKQIGDNISDVATGKTTASDPSNGTPDPVDGLF